MGEYADMVLNGDIDAVTFEELGNGDGFPRSKHWSPLNPGVELPEDILAFVEAGFDYRRFSEHHFRIEGTLDYWPARGKWLVYNTSIRGRGVDSAIAELCKRPALAALCTRKVKAARKPPRPARNDTPEFDDSIPF